MAQSTAKPTPRCYRHPQVETRISCSQCGKPLCPDCMLEAATGALCPECYAPGARVTAVPRATADAPPPRIATTVPVANPAVPLGALVGFVGILLMIGSGLIAPDGTPNLLITGLAGGFTGAVLWLLNGRTWNSRIALWGLLYGLLMPLLATIGLLLLHPGVPGNPIFYALRMLIAMGLCGLFSFLAASQPSGW